MPLQDYGRHSAKDARQHLESLTFRGFQAQAVPILQLVWYLNQSPSVQEDSQRLRQNPLQVNEDQALLHLLNRTPDLGLHHRKLWSRHRVKRLLLQGQQAHFLELKSWVTDVRTFSHYLMLLDRNPGFAS